jgi:FlaA1/EpsC-like NDP-sugar epimerase
LVAFVAFGYGFTGFSRSVLAVDCLLTLLFTGGLRLFIRVVYASGPRRTQSGPPRRVLLIGAGNLGERLLREINTSPELNFDVAGFLDDDPAKLGRSLHDRVVLGRVDELARIAQREEAQEVLIAVSRASAEQMRRIIDICKASKLPHRILPPTSRLLDGKAVLSLRPVDYQDLLGRTEVALDQGGLTALLTGRTVLITGCGGSIGSELCRQVLRFRPARLVLLDASEYNLYAVHGELNGELNGELGGGEQAGSARTALTPVLGSVADEALMDRVFAEHRPSLVLHAAAYKHVPMLEDNPAAAVLNNILGTRVAMQAAQRHGAERFVLVSTDKAVRPSSVMGASKRVTELLMQGLEGGNTRFMAVRFGNVVGSSGSVVPLFRQQIERGGPVTVTHQDMLRYFMSIAEACQLILQAGAMGVGGEIFVLNMGEPVRIVDLARDLIRLSGKEPGVDVDIVFTGLRPGEKLKEELVRQGEDAAPTAHGKILVLRGDGTAGVPGDVPGALERLLAASREQDGAAIRALLKRLVPDYGPGDGPGDQRES